MGLTLSLFLILNVQIYAYKNASQIRSTKIPQDDNFSSNESDRSSEISNKKFNHTTDKNEILDNFEKIKEQFYNFTPIVDVDVTEDPNPFGGEEFPPDEEEEEEENAAFTAECILARSEFYLSWWVNENGSLRVPTIARLNGSGIMDLSLNFTSEDSIYTKVFSFTTSNPSEVSPKKMQFFFIANISLKLVSTLP